MAEFRVWYSTESFADYIIDHTELRNHSVIKKKMYESDASKPKDFHSLPHHIKQILYLDAPDLIVECNMEPIFSIEITTEAGTGHNAFQRFARIAAAVENQVPAIYIYPEAVLISRRARSSSVKWDSINPLIFKALERVRDIYQIPALLFYYPSSYRSPSATITPRMLRDKGLNHDANVVTYSGCPDSRDTEMQKLFGILDLIVNETLRHGVIESRKNLLSKRLIINRNDWMNNEFHQKNGGNPGSPITATTIIDTNYLLNHLRQYSRVPSELLASRERTVIYQVNAEFRGDPYPGALSALDYLLCREGKTFEERAFNLVLCWGTIVLDHVNQTFSIVDGRSNPIKPLASVNDFVKSVKDCGARNMLGLDYNQIKRKSIPRYYMQVRYGSMFSKKKEIRVFSYFADAILFNDGALWREG